MPILSGDFPATKEPPCLSSQSWPKIDGFGIDVSTKIPMVSTKLMLIYLWKMVIFSIDGLPNLKMLMFAMLVITRGYNVYSNTKKDAETVLAAPSWWHTLSHASIVWCLMCFEPPINCLKPFPIGSMYGIYANIWGILMVNVTINI